MKHTLLLTLHIVAILLLTHDLLCSEKTPSKVLINLVDSRENKHRCGSTVIKIQSLTDDDSTENIIPGKIHHVFYAEKGFKIFRGTTSMVGTPSYYVFHVSYETDNINEDNVSLSYTIPLLDLINYKELNIVPLDEAHRLIVRYNSAEIIQATQLQTLE